MRRFSIALGVFLAVATGAAVSAQSPRVISGEDLALDYRKLIGQRVTIADCMLIQATSDRAGCFTGAPVAFSVDYANDVRETRRRAMAECAQIQVNARCFARVTGRVRGSLVSGVIGIEAASIEFRSN